jgi:hypothetical protein
MKFVSQNEPGIALETILAKHGFTFAFDGDQFGTLRLYKNGVHTQITCGSVLEAATNIFEALNRQGKKSALAQELQPILDNIFDGEFVWNAESMIRK